MKRIYLLLLLFTCLCVNHTFAQQPGYIVTQNNDTLKGEMKVPAFGRPKFKATNKAAFISLNLDTIKEYQTTKDSAVFVAKVLPLNSMNLTGKPQFLQRLERGKISLYEIVSADRYHLRTWYVSKGTDSLVAIKTDDIFLAGGGSKKAREQAFENMLSDRPDVFSAYKAAGKFDYDTIRAYIRRYNNASK